MVSSKGWTYGCEHEWADYDRRVPLPRGCENNRKDHTVVNSNGIANDPSDRLYYFGGEINTRPTSTPAGQVEVLENIDLVLERGGSPPPAINYRSNLHVHVRVPGLRDDLAKLKRIQSYVHQHMPRLLSLIEPIPVPLRSQYKKPAEHEGAMRRFKRRQVSHQLLLRADVLERQLAAQTVDEFFAAEAPKGGNGRVLHHLAARTAINLRQLLDTDTIEFRHFPGTLDPLELRACVDWCEMFLLAAFEERPVTDLLHLAASLRFPKFRPYVHWQELHYRATCHDGTNSRETIAENIDKILRGEFDDVRA